VIDDVPVTVSAGTRRSDDQLPLGWYSAILVHRIVVTSAAGTSDDEDDYAGALILVRATSEAAATAEAERVACAEDDEYDNADGERVNWRFVEVLDVRAAGTRLRSGCEVYSWMMSPDAFAAVRAEFEAES
jgi:hypothetical protein